MIFSPDKYCKVYHRLSCRLVNELQVFRLLNISVLGDKKNQEINMNFVIQKKVGVIYLFCAKNRKVKAKGKWKISEVTSLKKGKKI